MNSMHLVSSISNVTISVVVQAHPIQQMTFLHHVVMTMRKTTSELYTFNSNSIRGALLKFALLTLIQSLQLEIC